MCPSFLRSTEAGGIFTAFSSPDIPEKHALSIPETNTTLELNYSLIKILKKKKNKYPLYAHTLYLTTS